LMLIYSDGLTEAESVDEGMLGDGPVLKLLQRDSRSGADYVKASLLELLDTFTARQPQNDDITFIIIQRL
jgi:serine phosphatase RsbU (regulator of sigma subunit)